MRWPCGCHVCREKQHLDVREAMQREHIANDQKYTQAIRELQMKVRLATTSLILVTDWRHGSVVRTSVFGWQTFPDLRLVCGWHLTTLCVKCSLWVIQPGQLSRTWFPRQPRIQRLSGNCPELFSTPKILPIFLKVSRSTWKVWNFAWEPIKRQKLKTNAAFVIRNILVDFGSSALFSRTKRP